MQVYIEDILISNFIINYFLLKITSKIFFIKVSKFRFVIAGICGAIIALLYPIFNFTHLLFFVFKLIVGFFLVSIAFYGENFKSLIKYFLSFLFSTFLFGGFILLVNLKNQNLINLSVQFFVFYIMFIKILNLERSRNKISKFSYKIQTFINEKQKGGIGFVDTGNQITYNTIPLPIISIKFLLELYDIKHVDLHNLPFKIIDKLEVRVVNKKTNIFITKLDKFVIYNENKKHIFNDIYIGINFGLFNNFDALIPIEFLESEKYEFNINYKEIYQKH